MFSIPHFRTLQGLQKAKRCGQLGAFFTWFSLIKLHFGAFFLKIKTPAFLLRARGVFRAFSGDEPAVASPGGQTTIRQLEQRPTPLLRRRGNA